MKTGLIDADVVVYYAVHSVMEKVKWDGDDDPDPMIIFDERRAKSMVVDTLNAWVQGSGTKDPVLCFTDREHPNFRKRVCSWYKEDRPDEDRLPQVTDLEVWMKNTWEYRSLPHLEADDVIGLTMTENPKDFVAISTDKDMQTLCGHWYNPMKQETKRTSREQADQYWLLQTLTGDRVDNYFGAPGIGPKKAEKILEEIEGLGFDVKWGRILQAYQDQWDNRRWNEKFRLDDPEQEAWTNAVCARILRHGDYDFETNEVKIWKP